MTNKILGMAAMALCMVPMTSCDEDEPNIKRTFEEEKVEVTSRPAPTFAYGADPSWLTEMESKGVTFANAEGKEGDCLAVLKEVGFNACRLRVWVNPTDGWCDRSDVIAKAERAFAMGYSIMIDFHYSDVWADPANQRKPSVWDGCESVDEMAQLLYAHTKHVLEGIRAKGIDVAWVQIGNESTTGMCKTSSTGGSTNVNGAAGGNYAKLHAAGCKATKEVYPEAKIVVHFHNGWNQSLQTNYLDRLTAAGAEFDIHGVSIYPDFEESGWYDKYVKGLVSTLNLIGEKYGCDVMVCEVGCNVTDYPNESKIALNDIMVRCQTEVNNCKGVFYWEPQCSNEMNWNGGYKLGGFTTGNVPSEALLNAFGGNAKTLMQP